MVNKIFLSIACIALCSISAEAFAAQNIRVAIADNRKAVQLASDSSLQVEGALSDTDETSMTFTPASIGRRPVRIRSANGVILVNNKSYRGCVELRKKRNGLLLVINDLNIEDYLDGVIAAEIPHDWEFEALKAQAVASRTYALYQKREAGKRAYHIVATVNSQVYNGVAGERRDAVRAVRATKGIVIVYQGEIIPAFYHSSCGGHTENAEEFWGIDEPYLKGVDCECQEIAKYGLWERRINIARVAAALRRIGYRLIAIDDLNIVSLTPAGRVKSVAIRSAGKTMRISGEALRAALGNSVILSSFFELELMDGEAIFSGRGSGHGVGLCQWGAKEMAGRGYDFRAILSHYYPGTSLVQMK
jgi:stage II sporulation protein D